MGRGDDKLHFFEFKSIHLGIHTSDNSKQLSNISSVSIFKKNYHGQITFSCLAPGAVRATDRPAVSCLSPLLPGGRRRRRCTADTDLHCQLGLGVVPSGGVGGGGQQGADAPYYPAETESVCFPSLSHSYDNTIGPLLIAPFCNIIQHNIQPTLSAGAT